MDAGFLQDMGDFLDAAAFVIMVAKNAHDGDGAGSQVGGQNFRLPDLAQVSEVAG
jgi:hypothetical protein